MSTAIKHPVPDWVKPSFEVKHYDLAQDALQLYSYGNSGRQRVDADNYADVQLCADLFSFRSRVCSAACSMLCWTTVVASISSSATSSWCRLRQRSTSSAQSSAKPSHSSWSVAHSPAAHCHLVCRPQTVVTVYYLTLWRPLLPYGYSYKASCACQTVLSLIICNFWPPGTLTLSSVHQSARMSKITNDGLTWSSTGCLIAVPIWQQWASKG